MKKTTPSQLPLLLSVDQGAEQLGVSRARFYQLITGENAVIPSVTVGRLRRVASADLMAYVESLRADVDADVDAEVDATA